MNNNRHRQRGAIGISVLGSVILLAVLVVVAGKLVPVYLENNAVKSILTTLEGGSYSSSTEIRSRISKQFRVDGVKRVNTDSVSVVTGRNFFEIDISYQVKVPLVHNIEFLLTFSEQTEIPLN
ncbi:MAG: DUF4845 domain-containing protein [Gammaproteobacteria bacterium]|nr:DUF4845 domain-containing protein [Gammaproteobacteria bacterium]